MYNLWNSMTNIFLHIFILSQLHLTSPKKWIVWILFGIFTRFPIAKKRVECARRSSSIWRRTTPKGNPCDCVCVFENICVGFIVGLTYILFSSLCGCARRYKIRRWIIHKTVFTHAPRNTQQIWYTDTTLYALSPLYIYKYANISFARVDFESCQISGLGFNANAENKIYAHINIYWNGFEILWFAAV